MSSGPCISDNAVVATAVYFQLIVRKIRRQVARSGAACRLMYVWVCQFNDSDYSALPSEPRTATILCL